MFKIDAHQWRLYLAGRRVHGYGAGFFFLGVGLALIVHDFPDLRGRF